MSVTITAMQCVPYAYLPQAVKRTHFIESTSELHSITVTNVLPV